MPKTKPSLESCLGDPISFYNGEVHLRFAKDPYHEYYLVGQDRLTKCDGVTSVSSILDKSHYLKPWAVRVTADKLLRIMPSDEDEMGRKLVSPILWSEFEAVIKEAKKAHTEHFEEAGDVGTAAHNWIEDTIRYAIAHTNGVVEKMVGRKPEDERAINCGMAAFRWIETHRITFLKKEHKVYSRQHNYAGTTDAIAIVNSCTEAKCCPQTFSKQRSLLDWKTSNQLHNDYLLQTAAYCMAETEEFSEPFDARWILRLGKTEGDFESWYLPADTLKKDSEAFILCLTLKRAMRYIEHRMSEAKKARTARKRAKGT